MRKAWVNPAFVYVNATIAVKKYHQQKPFWREMEPHTWGDLKGQCMVSLFGKADSHWPLKYTAFTSTITADELKLSSLMMFLILPFEK